MLAQRAAAALRGNTPRHRLSLHIIVAARPPLIARRLGTPRLRQQPRLQLAAPGSASPAKPASAALPATSVITCAADGQEDLRDGLSATPPAQGEGGSHEDSEEEAPPMPGPAPLRAADAGALLQRGEQQFTAEWNGQKSEKTFHIFVNQTDEPLRLCWALGKDQDADHGVIEPGHSLYVGGCAAAGAACCCCSGPGPLVIWAACALRCASECRILAAHPPRCPGHPAPAK